MSNICEVALCLRSSDHTHLKNSAEALGFSALTDFLINPLIKIFNDSGDIYCLNRGSINWNETDKEIIFLRHFLDYHRHSFIRIGESIEDSEFDILPEDDEGEDDTFYNLLNVQTKILVAPGFIKLKKRKNRKESE